MASLDLFNKDRQIWNEIVVLEKDSAMVKHSSSIWKVVMLNCIRDTHFIIKLSVQTNSSQFDKDINYF